MGAGTTATATTTDHLHRDDDFDHSDHDAHDAHDARRRRRFRRRVGLRRRLSRLRPAGLPGRGSAVTTDVDAAAPVGAWGHGPHQKLGFRVLDQDGVADPGRAVRADPVRPLRPLPLEPAGNAGCAVRQPPDRAALHRLLRRLPLEPDELAARQLRRAVLLARPERRRRRQGHPQRLRVGSGSAGRGRRDQRRDQPGRDAAASVQAAAPERQLSDTEKQQLVDGMAKTYQQDPPGP